MQHWMHREKHSHKYPCILLYVTQEEKHTQYLGISGTGEYRFSEGEGKKSETHVEER